MRRMRKRTGKEGSWSVCVKHLLSSEFTLDSGAGEGIKREMLQFSDQCLDCEMGSPTYPQTWCSGFELVRNSTSIGLKGITQSEMNTWILQRWRIGHPHSVGSAREIFREVNAQPILKDQMVERTARDLVWLRGGLAWLWGSDMGENEVL